MIFDTNDPRLTAYALGEIDPAERSEIEQLLAGRAEARNYVAEIRQTAQWLAEELQKEPETVSTLAMANHRLIDQALKSAVPTANSRPWWRRPYRLMSMAATLLMGGTVGLFSLNAYQTGRQARNVFNPLPPLSKPRASAPAKSPTEALGEAPAMIRSFYAPASGPYAQQNSSNQMQRGDTRSAPNGNGQQFQVAQNTTAPGMPPAGALAYAPALQAAAALRLLRPPYRHSTRTFRTSRLSRPFRHLLPAARSMRSARRACPQRRGVRQDSGESLRAGHRRAALDLLDRRRYGQLCQRPAIPAATEPASAPGRGPHRGNAQLFLVPRCPSRAEQPRPVCHPPRSRPLPVERRTPPGPDRDRRQAHSSERATAQQPCLPDRCLRLDGRLTTSCRW